MENPTSDDATPPALQQPNAKAAGGAAARPPPPPPRRAASAQGDLLAPQPSPINAAAESQALVAQQPTVVVGGAVPFYAAAMEAIVGAVAKSGLSLAGVSFWPSHPNSKHRPGHPNRALSLPRRRPQQSRRRGRCAS